MKIIFKITFFACAFSSLFSSSSLPTSAPNIKVLLHRQLSHLIFEAKGRHDIYNPLDGTRISSGILSRRNLVTAETYGIKWGEKFPGHHQLRFVPGDSQSTFLVNGIQYRGIIEIYLNDGKFNVVNEIDIESYLKSILSVEFPTPLHEEVMNAIAILARTTAHFQVQQHAQAFWQVTSQEVNYQGSALLPKWHIDRAVNGTYPAILTYNDRFFPATWTQNSAGKTVDFAAIFRKALLAPPGVEAPLAAQDRETHQWSCAIPKNLLATATHLDQIKGIDLYIHPHSEKVYAVKVIGDSQTKYFNFINFQTILGKHKLRSNEFTVQSQENQLLFTGYGEGTSVGLCLHSAQIMADRGDKAPHILELFFPQTKLTRAISLK